LTLRDQDAAVARYDQPKVVVATNVAETSITIDGIGLVIDSGLARMPRYDPNRGINTLLVEKTSRASADQRTGRAGRTATGQCMRLWSQAEHDERPAQELPEIKRLDLSEVVLTLKAAGIGDLKSFRWLESPGEAALAHAEELLLDLGALESSGNLTSITPLGHRMLAFPVHPRYARMLIAADQFGCVYDACLVAALTQGRDLVLRRADPNLESSREDLFGDIVDDGTSDFEILIRAWNFAEANQFRMDALRQHGIHAVTARQVGPLLDQFLRIAKDTGLDVQRSKNNDAMRKCILIGFSDRVARRVDEGTLRCALMHGGRGTLAKESVAKNSELLVAAEVREIGGRQGEVNTILSLATAIPIEWLQELYPHDLHSAIQVEFDPATRRVQAETVLRFRDLDVSEKRVEPPPADASARLLAEEIMSGRLQLPSWDHGVAQWIIRLNLLARW
jgi:ATP-dependent helicase HrpB